MLDRADRNHIIGTPVVYEGLVYIGVGEDPEHGEGRGHLWCIDPTKRGDVSPELVFNSASPDKPIPPKRNQACVEADGDFTRANPNSAMIWHYEGDDLNGNGKLDSEETMHRTCGTVAIKDDLLFVADFCGIVHCLDAKTGKCHWTHDMLAACWASPLITDGKVYIGNEDGNVLVFKFGPKEELLNTDGHGLQRLQHPDRGQRRAIHLDAEPTVRHPKRREITALVYYHGGTQGAEKKMIAE